MLVHFASKLIIVLSNMWVALMLCFSGSGRFYGLCVQLSHGCALLEPGDLWVTLSVLIKLFQFLFTLKRVLMKQMQIQQKEAFLLSTLTPVPKNIYI